MRDMSGRERFENVVLNHLPCTSTNLGSEIRQVTTVARLISASSQKLAQAVL